MKKKFILITILIAMLILNATQFLAEELYGKKYFSLVNPPIPKSYNYQCPDCKGAFNQPACTYGTSVYSYKCPFCGRPMEGMNG